MSNGNSSGQITVNMAADDSSELTEQFQVTLVNTSGGADIDSTLYSSSFSIRFVTSSYIDVQFHLWSFVVYVVM